MPLSPSGLGGSLMQVSASTTQTHPLAYCVHRCDTRHITSTYTHIALLWTFLTKRETSKNFPRPREPVISIIMTLGNLFSAQDIAALKAVATSPDIAETYAPHVGPQAREHIYEFAAYCECICDKHFWQNFERAIFPGSDTVVLLKKGKQAEFIRFEPSKPFAWKMGENLKKGIGIILIRGHRCSDIHWGNWKRMYNILAGVKAPETQQYDPEMTSAEKREMREARRLKKQFNDGAEVIRRRKSMVPTTNEEAANQAYSVARDREFRAAAERDMAISGTVALANKIFAMV